MPKTAQIIPVSAYPQLVNNADAASIARALRGSNLIDRGNQVMEEQNEMLCAAVLGLADQLEQAGKDLDAVLLAAHEIRGLAGSARLSAAGRIADGLCRYCDEIDRLGLAPDRVIVDLHVGAILRASRIPAERGTVGDAVAKELAALVSHKLTEIKSLFFLTPSAFARDGRKRPACYGISPFQALRAKWGGGSVFSGNWSQAESLF